MEAEVTHAETRHSPIGGATEKIAALKRRHRQLASSVEYYEAEVARQTAQLNRMNRPQDFEYDDFDEDATGGQEQAPAFTVEDMRREEQEIKELERKKQDLEDRVTGMEKDLGGLMR